MFKQITSSIFLLAFVIQLFSGQFIQLNYYFNTAAFAKNCENKARPKMNCNGKCQMMKKIQQQEKKEQQLPQRKYGGKTEVLSSKSFFCSISITAALIQKNTPAEIISFPIDRGTAVFHPPQVCVLIYFI